MTSTATPTTAPTSASPAPTAAQAQLAHLLDGPPMTLYMRLSRLVDEWRLRARNGEPPHGAMLSERMSVDELTDAVATIARALADGVEQEHAERSRATFQARQAQERREADLLRRYPPAAPAPKPSASKRPTAAEMVV